VLKRIARSTLQFLNNDDGPTAVEYAVMLTLIMIVCLVSLVALGSSAASTFSYVSNQVKVKGS
jgi:pilus assembly protein Flp/PilA